MRFQHIVFGIKAAVAVKLNLPDTLFLGIEPITDQVIMPAIGVGDQSEFGLVENRKSYRTVILGEA